MKLILSQDVANLGAVGSVVDVRNGYARNYLIPRGLAVLADEQNKASFEHKLKTLQKRRDKLLTEARALASKIEKTSITVNKQVGEDERIFGSVTTSEIEELLAQEGIKVSKKEIEFLDEIKKVGVYTAQIKLHSEVIAKFKVWVVAST